MTKKIFKNKKVLIMGLGLNGGGVGVAKFFCKQGADVLVTDLKSTEILKESLEKLKKYKVKYSLGKHEEKDFLWADLIMKNPDVPNTSPYLEIARKNNIEIETDISLFMKLAKAFIIGVTGTKGKSTTSSLIYHLLKSKYKRTFLAGNIGISPLDLLGKIKKGDKVVLELSSFGLENLTQSPKIAVITNIMTDHLNRYGTMAEYIETKKIIFKYQNSEDILVLNEDDSYCLPVGRQVRQFAKEAKSKVYFYSEKNVKAPGFKLLGKQNLSNLSAAITVAKLLKVPEKNIKSSIKTFKGVHSRQEFVGEVGGVKYFNDTTATIPEAVVFAIESLSEKFPNGKMFLICGGVYKGVNYGEMAKKILEKNVKVIMLPGNASDKIKEGIGQYTEAYNVSSMQEAVKKASLLAKKGDIVVLSPAASSFNLFKNEFDRGKQFIKAVKNLK